MKTILLFSMVGEFAENKDLAQKIRIEQIIPFLEQKEKITLDFFGIHSATQSFIHALISDLIRKYDDEVFELILFKNCTQNVQQIINIVVDYMLERD